jgi:MFS family permease
MEVRSFSIPLKILPRIALAHCRTLIQTILEAECLSLFHEHIANASLTTGLLSFMTLITPLASSIFAPSVPEVLKTFKETNSTIASFVVSIYILGYAFGPLFIAPLSEIYGRSPVYHVTNVFFVIFTVCCAVSQNMGMLVAFRFLAGVMGSCPM